MPRRRINFLLKDASLKARAARGVIWTTGGMIASQSLRLLSNIVLTRLLFPEAFGLMSLVYVFITGLTLFSDVGIHVSVIQSKRGNEPAFLDTAWTLQIIRGFGLWICACILAFPLASFYDEPVVAQLLPVSALSLVIGGFAPTRLYTANRELTLGRQTLLGLVSQIFGIFSMIALAWIFQSVWALAIGTLLSNLAWQVLLFRYLPGRRNRIFIERSALGELVNFGKWIFVSTAFTFLMSHADRLLLGRFVSVEMLGIYSIALLLGSLPLMLGEPLTTKIILPLYKQRSPWESDENRQKIFRLRRLLTACLLIVSLGLSILGDVLVSILYDPRYQLAGSMLVLVAMSQLPQVILITYDRILLAAGDSKSYMIRSGIAAFVQTSLLVIGVLYFGVIGVILSSGIAAFLVYPVLVILTKKYKGWDPLHDAIAFVAAIGIISLSVWMHWDILVDLAAHAHP